MSPSRDVVEREEQVLQVIDNTQKQYEVKTPNGLRTKVVNAQDSLIASLQGPPNIVSSSSRPAYSQLEATSVSRSPPDRTGRA